MTPQEKAKQLANKYFKESDLLYEDLTWIQAKECALIAVDEILNSYDNIFDDFVIKSDQVGGYKNMKKYWNEVKQEIEKL